jgi:hypothetical protein
MTAAFGLEQSMVLCDFAYKYKQLKKRGYHKSILAQTTNFTPGTRLARCFSVIILQKRMMIPIIETE